MKASEAKKLSAQVIRAEIGGTAQSHDGRKEFVIYCVHCTTRDGRGWQCRKRFSEFVKLKDEMALTGCDGIAEVKLPPKRVLRGNGSRVVEERIAGLQHFLAKAIGMYADHGVLIQFLAQQPDGQGDGHGTAPPGWRLKESRERLEQLREMVVDLHAQGGESDPMYQAMLAKLQVESRAFQAGQGSAVAAGGTVGAGGGSPLRHTVAQGSPRGRTSVGGAPDTPKTPQRSTMSAFSEKEREQEMALTHGAMSHDRGLELQKELQEQKQQAPIEAPTGRRRRLESGGGGMLSRQSSIAAAAAAGSAGRLYNAGSFGKTYTLGRMLGEGAFGRVYQCTHNETHSMVAVKMVPTNQQGFKEVDLLEETRLQQLCGGHPNIVQIFDLFKEKKALYLVQEVVGGGDLFSLVIKRQSAADAAGLDSPFTEAAASKIIVQIVSAIAHCHSRGVMHRDLKPENILCLADDEEQLKLCDFGLACEFEQDKLILKQAGSVEYAAPEVLTYGMGYGPPADVWSIGVIVYVLLCGRLPFRGASTKEAVEAVQRMPLEFPDAEWGLVSEEAKGLIRDTMINRDPDARSTAEELLSHPWLSGAAPDLALGSTLQNLKGFNARNRFKNAVNGVIMARRMQLIMSSLFAEREAADFSHNYTIDHVHRLCEAFAKASGELHTHSESPHAGRRGDSFTRSSLKNRRGRNMNVSHKNYIPVETFGEVLDTTLELQGDTAMVDLHQNAFATGYLRRWIDFVSYLIGLATSFGATTDEKLTHAFVVLCKLDEEGDRDGEALHLAEFVALIDSTQGLTGEHDEAAINELFRQLAGDDEDFDEGEEAGKETMTADQFLEAAKTTPQLLRYFASIGLLVAPLETGDAQAQSSAFAADMEARAVDRAHRAVNAGPSMLESPGDGEDRYSFEEGGLLADGETTSASLGLPPEGLGGGRPGKEHGARSRSPPPIREQMLFEMRRAFALYDTGDGTVARADGWRILQTMGEDDHTPEDFEQVRTGIVLLFFFFVTLSHCILLSLQLLSPRVAEKPSGTVGRLSEYTKSTQMCRGSFERVLVLQAAGPACCGRAWSRLQRRLV